MTLTDSEFLDDRPIPRDCEHGTLARQCELCECKAELAAARAELALADFTCKELAEKVNSQSAQLERAMPVVDAAIAFLHFGGDRNTVHDMKCAVKEWEAGR